MVFDPARLREVLGRVDPSSWSLPSTYDGTGVHEGYRRVVLVDHGRRLAAADPWGFVLDEFAPVRDSWLSWIRPGGFIVSHRDAGPWHERWQVPICAAGTFTQAGVTFTPTAGVPFQVTHWEPHRVDNPDGPNRVHLVVDRQIVLDRPAEPFALFKESS